MKDADGIWHIGTDEAVARVMRSVAQEPVLSRTGTPVPTVTQVAAVLHALADHTALTEAVGYAPSPEGDVALSVGRWLHSLGDYFEDSARSADKVVSNDVILPGTANSFMTDKDEVVCLALAPEAHDQRAVNHSVCGVIHPDYPDLGCSYPMGHGLVVSNQDEIDKGLENIPFIMSHGNPEKGGYWNP